MAVHTQCGCIGLVRRSENVDQQWGGEEGSRGRKRAVYKALERRRIVISVRERVTSKQERATHADVPVRAWSRMAGGASNGALSRHVVGTQQPLHHTTALKASQGQEL